MAESTGISWCDSTFNPWVGCSRISPACDNCYAEAYARRTGQAELWQGKRRRTSAVNWKLPVKWNAHRFMECGKCGWRGECSAELIGCGACGSIEEMNDTRRRVFCASLADIFDNEVDPAWRSDLFRLIEATPNLDWLLLTKRIGNVTKLTGGVSSWPNVWLGATVVNQEEADRDIPKLLATPARVRFLSIEPMLGPINLTRVPVPRGLVECNGGTLQPIDWVIVGGESGQKARPMHPGWVRRLRDQCALTNVPFHFKQWGEWGPEQILPVADSHRWPIEPGEPEGGVWSYRSGKKRTGRLIDGQEHNGFPR